MRCAPFFLLAGLLPGTADQAWEGQTVSFNLENDALVGNDRHYTAGTSIQYFSRDDALYGWTRWLSRLLPAAGFEIKAEKWGVEVGQQIYTPEDLRTAALIIDDRPYAGWLYARAALQRRGPGIAGSHAMELIGLDLGVVGPESMARQAQALVHGDDPQGWHNQLETEVTVDLRYLRRHLLEYHFANWRLHVIPSLDASVGTLDTHIGGGMLMRFGYNVPNEFEVAQAPTRPGWGAYLFSGVEGRWVIHNLFLDGNNFRSSHSVDKEPLLGSYKFGVGLVFKRMEVLLSHTFLTQEFKLQDTHDSFSSASVVFKF